MGNIIKMIEERKEGKRKRNKKERKILFIIAQNWSK